MGRMERLSVEVSPELREAVDQAVASGEYGSAEDVIAAALARWQEDRLLFGYSRAELIALIEKGENSGEPVDGEEAFQRIEAELERYIESKG